MVLQGIGISAAPAGSITAALSSSESGRRTTANQAALTDSESRWPASATLFRLVSWVPRDPREEAATSSYTNPIRLTPARPTLPTSLLPAAATTRGWDCNGRAGEGQNVIPDRVVISPFN